MNTYGTHTMLPAPIQLTILIDDSSISLRVYGGFDVHFHGLRNSYQRGSDSHLHVPVHGLRHVDGCLLATGSWRCGGWQPMCCGEYSVP